MDRRTLLAGSLTALASPALLGSRPALAQAYPTRPVRIVVPYPAGQGSDIFARRFCDHFQQKLGQPFLVENRTGAGGNLGTATVARSDPDGYTLLWGTNATHAGNEFLYANLGYDPIKDFDPVAGVIRFGMAFAVAKGSRIKSMADLVALAKEDPKKLFVGLPSNSSRVVFQLWREKAGIETQLVPYSGSGQALTGLIRNDVQVVVDTVTALLGPSQSDQATILAISTEKRSKSLEGVPILKELGFDVALEAWNALYAPRGTPLDIRKTMNRAIEAALAEPSLAQQLVRDGADAMGGSPEDLVALMKRDRAIWGPIVRSLGLSAQ